VLNSKLVILLLNT